jgi:hypothetical protein
MREIRAKTMLDMALMPTLGTLTPPSKPILGKLKQAISKWTSLWTWIMKLIIATDWPGTIWIRWWTKWNQPRLQ